MTTMFRRTKIKDCEYAIKLLDGDAALTGFGTLAKYAGGPIGLLLASGASGEKPELVADGLRELGTAISAPDMRDLMYAMLEGLTVTHIGGQSSGPRPATPLILNGNRELFKAHFTGKIGEIILLTWFALKENYANFFAVLPGLDELAQRLKSLGLSRVSPPATTGESPG